MNDIIAKLIVLWLAGASPDGGVPVQYAGNHDADSVTVGFACTKPVTATISFEGLSMVQVPAGAKPLTITIPCLRGMIPMDVRVSGIDTPEVGASGCATATDRQREKTKGLAARDVVTGWLRNAQGLTLYDADIVSEKWGRTLSRIVYTEASGTSYDLGGKLILLGYAHAYSGGTKESWCGS